MKFRSNLKNTLTSTCCSSVSRWLQFHIHAASLLACRYAGTLLSRGFQIVLPNSDKLHVRHRQAPGPGAAGLHLLHVAETCGGRHWDAALLRCPRTAQWAGAAARPAYTRRAARRRQGAPSLQVPGGQIFKSFVKSLNVVICYVQIPPNLQGLCIWFSTDANPGNYLHVYGQGLYFRNMWSSAQYLHCANLCLLLGLCCLWNALVRWAEFLMFNSDEEALRINIQMSWICQVRKQFSRKAKWRTGAAAPQLWTVAWCCNSMES